MDKRCYDLEIENIGLKKQVESLKAENAALRHRAETAEAEVQMLNGTKKKLEKQLNTNFEISSLSYLLYAFDLLSLVKV